MAEPEFVELQQKLVDSRAVIRERSKGSDERNEDLKQLEAQQANLYKLVQRYQEKVALSERIRLLEKKKPWLEYNEARAAFISKKEERDAAEKELMAAREVIAPTKRELK